MQETLHAVIGNIDCYLPNVILSFILGNAWIEDVQNVENHRCPEGHGSYAITVFAAGGIVLFISLSFLLFNPLINPIIGVVKVDVDFSYSMVIALIISCETVLFT